MEREQRLHFVVDSAAFGDDVVRRGDVIVDLTFRGSLNQEPDAAAYIVPTGYGEDCYIDLATELLSICEAFPIGFRCENRSLAEWFAWDDRYNLLWASELTTCLPNSTLVSGAIALAGLSGSQRANIRELALNSDCYLHVGVKESKVWKTLVEKNFGISQLKVRSQESILDLRSLDYPVESILRITRDILFIELNADRSVEPPRHYDVVLVGFPSSYSRIQDVETDRYHSGLVEWLNRRGIRATILPAVPGGWALQVFKSRDWSGSPDEPNWPLLRYPSGFGAALGKRFLQKVLDLRRVLNALEHHPCWFQEINIGPLIYHEVSRVAGHIGFEQVFLYESLRHSTEASTPALVLLKDEFFQTGISVTAAVDAPCLGIQHGLIPKDHFVYIKPESILQRGSVRSASGRRPAPDFFLAYGTGVAKTICSRGMNPEKVKPIGSVRHQKSDPPVPPSSNTLLVCLETLQQAANLLPVVRDALAQTPIGVVDHVVLRPHPRVPTNALIHSVFMDSTIQYSISTGSFEEALNSCRWVITESSTTGIEALVTGRDLLVYMPRDRYVRFPYATEGPAKGFATSDELAMALQVDEHEPSNEFLKNYLYGEGDGGRIELLKLIQSLLSCDNAN